MELVQKGQSIQLKSKSGVQLTRVAVGLGWGKKRKKGFFGGIKEVGVDLDASCILYGGNKVAIDTVYFGKLRSSDGSVLHTGDDLVVVGAKTNRTRSSMSIYRVSRVRWTASFSSSIVTQGRRSRAFRSLFVM